MSVANMGDPTSAQQVLTHICQVLELDPQVVTFLEIHRIKSVRRFTSTTVDRYEELASLARSPLDKTDIDQINLFRTWYTNLIQKEGGISHEFIIQELTESSWDTFCNSYLVYVTQQAQKVTSPAPQTPSRQEH